MYMHPYLYIHTYMHTDSCMYVYLHAYVHVVLAVYFSIKEYISDHRYEKNMAANENISDCHLTLNRY